MHPHPVEVLRDILANEFNSDLPDGVHPVRQWCADPQFFPGATGLVLNQSWEEVRPGSAGVIRELPPAPNNGVLVLGNYQATLDSYRRIADGTIGGFPTTWRVLRQLLASVPPTEVFLTNAFIGLPDVAKDTSPFPKTQSFRRRCERLLVKEIELLRPRAVVCLGVPAARMLAEVTPTLSAWRPWPGYTSLHRRKLLSVPKCAVGDVQFVGVAVHHPAAVVSSEDRTIDASLVATATSR